MYVDFSQVVESEGDVLNNNLFIGYRAAQLNLEKMRCLFEKSLDIADMLITVNACNAEDQGFEVLKEILKQMATDILVRNLHLFQDLA